MIAFINAYMALSLRMLAPLSKMAKPQSSSFFGSVIGKKLRTPCMIIIISLWYVFSAPLILLFAVSLHHMQAVRKRRARTPK